jgi:hypothetical protein
MRRVLRWVVPVDDAWHRVGAGKVLHVACRLDDPTMVHVWTEEHGAPVTPTRKVRVYGTGHVIGPEAGDYLGTGQAGPLVWHVFEEVTR